LQKKKLPILGLWEVDLYTTIHWRRVNNLVLIIFTTTNEIYDEPVLPFQHDAGLAIVAGSTICSSEHNANPD
jgi:hypothetical protein